MTNEQLYQEMQNYQEDLESGEEEVTEVSSLEVLVHVWKCIHTLLEVHVWKCILVQIFDVKIPHQDKDHVHGMSLLFYVNI